MLKERGLEPLFVSQAHQSSKLSSPATVLVRMHVNRVTSIPVISKEGRAKLSDTFMRFVREYTGHSVIGFGLRYGME